MFGSVMLPQFSSDKKNQYFVLLTTYLLSEQERTSLATVGIRVVKIGLEFDHWYKLLFPSDKSE
jgi:hypothetical protein